MKPKSHNTGKLRCTLQRNPLIVCLRAVGFVLFITCVPSLAQSSVELRKSLLVLNSEPVELSIAIRKADVDILYNREGEVSITAVARAENDSKLDDAYFAGTLGVEQLRNHVSLRQIANEGYSEEKIKVRFRIDVPYRTEVSSVVGEGRQVIRGILGPAEARAGRGDINASYVSKTVHAETGRGNLDLQVIGEHVEAKTLDGNISGERLPQGISAETHDGDITLSVVGACTATVKRGTGRIDVGGARGPLTASTDLGTLHVQAVPHEDWNLNSNSGTIRIDLPPAAKFELEASTSSGEIQIERDDLSKAATGLHQTIQQANGGGKRIKVQTETGKIVIR